MMDFEEEVNVTEEEVYYDVGIGQYVWVELSQGLVREVDAFDGGEIHTWTVDEFVEEGVSNELLELSPEVFDNPVRVVEDVFSNVVLSDMRDPFMGFDPWEVEFAWRCTLVCERDGVAFQNVMGGDEED